MDDSPDQGEAYAETIQEPVIKTESDTATALPTSTTDIAADIDADETDTDDAADYDIAAAVNERIKERDKVLETFTGK